MSKVKIETLTPVHIGSGNTLYKGMDYVVVNDNLFVIDHNKVLDIIGTDKIDAWVTSIDNSEDIAAFISRQGVKTHPKEYSTRNMRCGKKGDKEYKTLKECIHDGRGLPYIPGSSIKGAIRTAVLATEIGGKEDEYDKIIDYRGGRYKAHACDKVEEALFSKTVKENNKGITASNTSCFRFLQVGDAYFGEGSEAVFNAINLNIRESFDSLIDKTKQQAIEVVDKNQSACLDMQLNKVVYKRDNDNLLRALPESLNSFENLFKAINKHTRGLLEGELQYWRDISKDYDDAEGYIASIKKVIAIAKSVEDGKECILRVGHASGWRFTTGGWTEALDTFYDTVVPISRPNDKAYREYDFPKSRRVYEVKGKNGMEAEVFGFVKLTLL